MSLPRQIVPGRVYMVTRRCTQRQFLLRPDSETNNAFVYCLALATKRAHMRLVAFLAHSNHHHTIVVDPEGRMPEFLENFHKLLAKHQNALRGRWENFWAAEATSVVELPDGDAVLAKMAYVLTNPVKDHLIERADQWPGASSLRANLDNKKLHAHRPLRFFRRDGELPETVSLRCVRPPGFEDLSHDQWRTLVSERVRAVELDSLKARQTQGTRIVGRAKVVRQRPTDRPRSHEPRRQLSPRVASPNKWARIEALQRNKAFITAYRAARDMWQSGLDTLFPWGTYWLRRFAGVLVEVPAS
jgi:putative transposase